MCLSPGSPDANRDTFRVDDGAQGGRFYRSQGQGMDQQPRSLRAAVSGGEGTGVGAAGRAGAGGRASAHSKTLPQRLVCLLYMYPTTTTHYLSKHTLGPVTGPTHTHIAHSPPPPHSPVLCGAAARARSHQLLLHLY